MQLGVCSQEISRGSVGEVFEAIRNYGFKEIQFNMLSVCGIETPDVMRDEWEAEIVAAKNASGIDIVAINGVFNMIHPDLNERERGLRGFEGIARICAKIGCGLVSLNTGTYCRASMWKPHRYNNTNEAWSEMRSMMERVLDIAEAYDINVGVEPEASNVVNSSEKAARLIKEMQSERIKIIMDCANLFHEGEANKASVRPIMEYAFELLGRYVTLAHGKDIKESNGIEFTSAGNGIVDFSLFGELLRSIGYTGSMILHGFSDESEISKSIRYLNCIL